MNFIENESKTKLRGGYYTDPKIASFLTRWISEIKPESILEPSCGDGVFVASIAKHVNGTLRNVLAIDIEANELEKAASYQKLFNENVRINFIQTDFLEWTIKNSLRAHFFDAVIGNPPFIRYQYLPSYIQDRAEQIFGRFKLPFTKHTNLWVSFVLASISLLRPGGRLAMVVPSEILHVTHSQSLRNYLLEQCDEINIVDPEELWFGETLQGVVLLLAQKKNPGDQKEARLVILPAKDRKFLDHDLDSLSSNFIYGKQSNLNRKWTWALLSQNEQRLLQQILDNSNIAIFKDIAKVDVGIVTGANDFFLVTDSVVKKYKLEKWARQMFGRSDHVHGVIYDKKNHELNRKSELPTNFLWFKGEPFNRLPKSAQEYLMEGIKQKLPLRYKCRIREPWYEVPSVFTSPVGMLKRAHNFPRLILNQLKAFTTDTAYRIYPKNVKADRLVFSFVNSLTALTAELEGRHYGGGVLELVPSEIEKLVIPLPNKSSINLSRLNNQIKSGKSMDDLFEAQDEDLLLPIGISKKDILILRNALYRMMRRRKREKAGANELPNG